MRNHARTSDWRGAGLGLGQEELSVRGSDSGGQRAAILYTLIQTAVLNGLDP
jgi:transposase